MGHRIASEEEIREVEREQGVKEPDRAPAATVVLSVCLLLVLLLGAGLLARIVAWLIVTGWSVGPGF